MPSFRIFAGSAPARGRREALVRSSASVPRTGGRADDAGTQWVPCSVGPADGGPGLVVGDGLGVGVSGDELGDGGAVPPPRTRITAL